MPAVNKGLATSICVIWQTWLQAPTFPTWDSPQSILSQDQYVFPGQRALRVPVAEPKLCNLKFRANFNK